jgi:hypothetical protein
MKKLTWGFFSLARAILLTAMAWGLSFNARAQTIFNTETKLVPNPSARELMFGLNVAIDGNTAAVRALLAPFNGQSGVYIFSLVGTNWVQSQILTAELLSGIFDEFGVGLALSSNVLVVGQPAASMTNVTGVYIYTNAGTTWSLQQKLVETGSVGDGFGESVGVSGETIAVGNPSESSITNNSGAVYVYNEIGTTWLLQAKLKANDPTSNALLGNKVAIDGDTILAAAAGAAYVFVRDGTNWTQQQKLVRPPLELTNSFANLFALDVALEGNIAAIVGQQTDGGANNTAVYIFARTGTNWDVQQVLTLPGTGATNFLFASSVAIHNGEIAVGIPSRTVDGLAGAGVVEVYQFNGTNWFLAQEIAATDAKSGADLGTTVDFGDAGIIAGAPDLVDVGRAGQGAAYIFSATGTNPPVTLSASATPNVLWPPNHKMVSVTITVNHPEDFTSCKIVSVTSNEPVIGKGSGKTSPDFIITGDLTLQLRAERSGKTKAGRIYTIQVACTDLAGNTTSTTVLVTVPKNNKTRSVVLPISPGLPHRKL